MKTITICLIALTLFVTLSITGLAQSQGPNKPDTAFDNPLLGTAVWSNPLNAKDSDKIYAYDSISGGKLRSQFLEATGFNFSIPPTATITGITVQVCGHQHNKSLISAFNYVRLVRGLVVQPDSIKGTGLANGSDTWQTIGGCSNIWNDTTWTPIAINSPSFGAAYFATATFLTLTGYYSMYIDAIRITVCYTTPTSTETLSQTSTAGIIYPNPSHGTLELQYTGKYLMQIYGLTGKEMYSANMQGNQQLDLSGLPNGIYFMHVTSCTNTWVKKLVLQK